MADPSTFTWAAEPPAIFHGHAVNDAAKTLLTRPAFVVLYNDCAAASDAASKTAGNENMSPTAKLSPQLQLEMDMSGHVASCDAAFWNGVGCDQYSLQNVASHAVRPETVANGSATRNAVVVEATRSNDIKILQFKLCKLEKNLTYLLNARGARSSSPISEFVAFCVLATEVHEAGARIILQQEEFVISKAAELVLVSQLYRCGRLLLMRVHVDSVEYCHWLNNQVAFQSNTICALQAENTQLVSYSNAAAPLIGQLQGQVGQHVSYSNMATTLIDQLQGQVGQHVSYSNMATTLIDQLQAQVGQLQGQLQGSYSSVTGSSVLQWGTFGVGDP